jgi:hypothetical protein
MQKIQQLFNQQVAEICMVMLQEKALMIVLTMGITHLLLFNDEELKQKKNKILIL